MVYLLKMVYHGDYPLVNSHITMENHQINSGFTIENQKLME